MLYKRSRIYLSPTKYKALCKAVMERDGWRCRCCKRRDTLQAHHIIFRSHGGDDASWNLITLCDECHKAMHNHSLLIEENDYSKTLDANKKVTWQFVSGWKPSMMRSCGGGSSSA